MAELNKLVVIVGPTASGKTALSIDIAKNQNGEIICADSRTIYRYMDIGTAKPTHQEQADIMHHLLDIKDPNEAMSVVEFKTLCENTINDIQNRGKVPIMVGGSGMYVDSVLFNYQFRPDKQIIDVSGMDLEEKLSKAHQLYPRIYASIDKNNERRIDQLLRFGPAGNSDRENIKIECKIIGLKPKTAVIKQNIEYRTAQMLNNGLVQEARNIINKFGPECPGLNTIGYKQVVSYIKGELEESELSNAINRATQGLAKRQLTWFKRNGAINWVDSTIEAQEVCNNYLGNV